MSSLFKRIAKSAATGMHFGGMEGTAPGVRLNPYGPSFVGLPGAQFDYQREAGYPWDNSIVAIALSWLWERFGQAEPIVERKRRSGQWEVVTNHPATRLLNIPNQSYDSDTLFNGFLLGDSLSGNSYFYINRSRAKLPVELYCLPYFQCEPKWDVGSGNFIDRYEYLPLGLTARNYEVKDIVHIKHGVDPLNTRLGFSRSARILRHIATDNSISTAAAALMRNGGLLGLMISPEGESIVPEDQIEKLIELGKSKITGERSGEPWVHSLPLKVEQIGYAPKDMSFNDIIQVPEERIAASFGIPITVLQLHAGLQRTSENNVGEAKREAYEGGLCTRWDRLGKVLTRQLLTQFGDDPETMRVRFDYSKIPALQEDVTARHSRARENWLAGGMTLNEYRQEIGLPSLDEDEGDRFRGDSSTDSNETDDTKDKNDE